jgi:hypothetical protein
MSLSSNLSFSFLFLCLSFIFCIPSRYFYLFFFFFWGSTGGGKKTPPPLPPPLPPEPTPDTGPPVPPPPPPIPQTPLLQPVEGLAEARDGSAINDNIVAPEATAATTPIRFST